MNKEKLVVVLLLITIILSAISLVVTLSTDTTRTQQTSGAGVTEGSSTVSFGIAPSTSSGGAE